MNSVNELKTIINSFENNIADEDLIAFDKVISEIWQGYENTVSVTTLLKMLRALKKYLKFKKENVHKETLPLLTAISLNLEKIIDTPYLEDDEVEKIVTEQICTYKNFQGVIASKPDITVDDIDNLKAVILAIDWEISETTMQNFESVVTQFLLKLKNYKIHYIFLKIMQSTGKYIDAQKANASADTISFLKSVFDSFNDLVQAEGMAYADKKRLLEKNIIKFQEFKKAILNPQKTNIGETELAPNESAQSEQDQAEIDLDEPEMAPALSHISSSSDNSNDEFIPLTQMPDENDGDGGKFEQHAEVEDVEPALSDNGPSPGEQKDVMGDLFNMKDSPADELLDAIHLMEVHGEKGEGQAMQMLDDADDHQGLKSFTPEKKDTRPIPEIESRLDEFFSLETPDKTSEMSILEPMADTSGIAEDIPAAEEKPESIIPFEPDDESFDETADTKEALSSSSDQNILDRLKYSIEAKEYQQDKNALDDIAIDIQSLIVHWKTDPQKINLLKIIALTLNLPADSITGEDLDDKDQSGAGIAEDNQSSAGSKGLLGKIKSIFTN